jgi:hypothetical protein
MRVIPLLSPVPPSGPHNAERFNRNSALPGGECPPGGAPAAGPVHQARFDGPPRPGGQVMSMASP